MVELRLAEPPGFQRIIAMRKPRIAVCDGGDERLDNLRLNTIGEVARIGDVL